MNLLSFAPNNAAWNARVYVGLRDPTNRPELTNSGFSRGSPPVFAAINGVGVKITTSQGSTGFITKPRRPSHHLERVDNAVSPA
jgi:hypothetical protein